MKVLVCGDRNWKHKGVIRREMYRTLTSDLHNFVIHGDATGADWMACQIANEMKIPCMVYEAHWKRHGRAAGPIRNREMLNEKPDLVLAFHNNIERSRGTKDCVTEARRRGIPVRVITSQ